MKRSLALFHYFQLYFSSLLPLLLFCFVLPLHEFVLLEIIPSSNKKRVICGTEMRLQIRV